MARVILFRTGYNKNTAIDAEIRLADVERELREFGVYDEWEHALDRAMYLRLCEERDRLVELLHDAGMARLGNA